jgi:hypothetical protein
MRVPHWYRWFSQTSEKYNGVTVHRIDSIFLMRLSAGRLEKKPYALFCLVDPVLEETGSCHVEFLIAEVVEMSHVTH